MDYKIIADSCCDMTEELKERLDMTSIPLTMRLGQKEYLDDDSLEIDVFMADMKANTEKAGSACPPPFAYQEAMEKAKDSFIVTLSSRLSGSYGSAVLGSKLAKEDAGAEAHVFDSKSASAGETLIVLKIHELIHKNTSRESIISQINEFIAQMKTYFVLENYENLQKNGRMSRVKGMLASVLNLKLIMGSDSDGNIALYAKPRGMHHMIERLMLLIKESGKKTDGEKMVISHCNNSGLAERLADAVRERYRFKEIFIIPTGGLSSLYTDDKGIVMAF